MPFHIKKYYILHLLFSQFQYIISSLLKHTSNHFHYIPTVTYLVYALKNTLSIGEINRILQNVYEQPDFTPEMLEQTYCRFLDIKALEREAAWKGFCHLVEQTNLDVSDDADYFTLILSLSAASSYLKTMTQALLEAKYPEIDPEKEQQVKDELKRQKKELKKESKRQKKEVTA